MEVINKQNSFTTKVDEKNSKDNVAQTTNETATATTEVKTSVAGDKDVAKEKSEKDKLKERFGELGNLQEFRKIASLGTKDIAKEVDNRLQFTLDLENEDVFLAYLKRRRKAEDMVSHGAGFSFLAIIINFVSLFNGGATFRVRPITINPDKYFKIALNEKNIQKFLRNGKITLEKQGHKFEIIKGEGNAERSEANPTLIIASTVMIDGKAYNYKELRKELEERYGEEESVRVLSSLCDFVADIMTDDERVQEQKEYLKVAHREPVLEVKKEIFKAQTQAQAEVIKPANQETPTIDPDIAAACAELSAKPGNFNRAKTVDTSLVDNIPKVEQEEILDSFATAEASVKKTTETNYYKPESLFSYKEETKTDEQTLKN